MAIILPKTAITDNQKLAYLYRKQEKLRLWHNEVGAKFRNGEITERQWLNFLSVFKPLNYELSCNLAPIKDKQVKELAIAQKIVLKDFDLIGFKNQFKKDIQYDNIIKDEINSLIIPDLDLVFVDPLEDFTTYVETDTGGSLTVTAPKIDVDTLARKDGATYVYKDFTADHFDALDTLFEILINTTSSEGVHAGPSFASVVENLNNYGTTEVTFVINREAGGYRSLLIRGSWTVYDLTAYDMAGDTLYYPTFGRTAGNDVIESKIYTNADRTTLHDTLSVAGFGTTKYRYAYGFQFNLGSSTSTEQFTGYTQNLDLQEVAALLKIVSEVLNIGEAKNYTRGRLKVVSEVLNITELKNKLQAKLRIISEVLNISEIKNKLQNKLRVINEVLNITEVKNYWRGRVKVISESLSVVEGFIKRIIVRPKYPRAGFKLKGGDKRHPFKWRFFDR